MAPDEHHRRAWRGGKDDAAGNVLVGLLRPDKGRKHQAEEKPRQGRHRERLHHPVDEKRDEQPGGRRPTSRTAEKSTFIIIGVIISQISTAMGC